MDLEQRKGQTIVVGVGNDMLYICTDTSIICSLSQLTGTERHSRAAQTNTTASMRCARHARS